MPETFWCLSVRGISERGSTQQPLLDTIANMRVDVNRWGDWIVIGITLLIIAGSLAALIASTR
jgi:hypothetical protein